MQRRRTNPANKPMKLAGTFLAYGSGGPAAYRQIVGRTPTYAFGAVAEVLAAPDPRLDRACCLSPRRCDTLPAELPCAD